IHYPIAFVIFFFSDTATTDIYTLSLHDALPIWVTVREIKAAPPGTLDVAEAQVIISGGRGLKEPANFKVLEELAGAFGGRAAKGDRKSTRLNSSHVAISYAVFCLKKKKNVNSKG